ncbi:hypothetical protein HYQ46_006973 [Verticillium longisporum]|nr:hypothetical protein HYQ46_006973 [Verticillium longisporum]
MSGGGETGTTSRPGPSCYPPSPPSLLVRTFNRAGSKKVIKNASPDPLSRPRQGNAASAADTVLVFVF